MAMLSAMSMPVSVRPAPTVRAGAQRAPALRSGLASKRANTAIRVKGVTEPADNDNTWETAANETKKGAAPGARQWPPKPITEHGQPKPEDDPANYENGKRVRGPPEEEIQKRRAEAAKKNPFTSEGGRPSGGTQQGGGGEGSGA